MRIESFATAPGVGLVRPPRTPRAAQAAGVASPDPPRARPPPPRRWRRTSSAARQRDCGRGEEVGCGSWVLEAVCGREPKGETELIIRWRFQISSSCCEAPGLGHRDVCHSSHVCSSAGARSHGRERMAVTEKRVEMVKSICIGTSGGFIRFSCRVCDIKIKKASCYTF